MYPGTLGFLAVFVILYTHFCQHVHSEFSNETISFENGTSGQTNVPLEKRTGNSTESVPMGTVTLETILRVYGENETSANITGKSKFFFPGGLEVVPPPKLGKEPNVTIPEPNIASTTDMYSRDGFIFPDQLPGLSGGFQPISNPFNRKPNWTSSRTSKSTLTEEQNTIEKNITEPNSFIFPKETSKKAPFVTPFSAPSEETTSNIPTTGSNIFNNTTRTSPSTTRSTQITIDVQPAETDFLVFTDEETTTVVQFTTSATSPDGRATGGGASVSITASKPRTTVVPTTEVKLTTATPSSVDNSDNVLAVEAETEPPAASIETFLFNSSDIFANSTIPKAEEGVATEKPFINITDHKNGSLIEESSAMDNSTATNETYRPDNSTEFCLWDGDLKCSKLFKLRCFGKGILNCTGGNLTSYGQSNGENTTYVDPECSMEGDIRCNSIPTKYICSGSSSLNCYESSTDDKWRQWEIYLMIFVGIFVSLVIFVTIIIGIKKWKESKIVPQVNTIEVKS